MTPISLNEVTPEQMDLAAEANLVRHMAWIQQRTPGMRVEGNDEVTLVDSGLPSDTFNIVCRAHLPEDALHARVSRVIAYFAVAGRPFAWWFGPADRPSSLGAILGEFGLTAAESEAAMAADLDALDLAEPEPPPLRIERARTPEQVHDFAAVVAANWTPPDLAVLRFYEQATPVLIDPECPLRFYVGHWEGQAVGACELTVGGGVVGLYSVCTLEAYRRRGIAGTLVCRCLLDAREQGWRTAVLQASKAGQRVYARTGFRVTGTFTEYKPPPTP